ncbi:response regulator transcription factor [uncultured Corynebacterium sp.]|uniref:response regulator transcription factor n=1 Tax=uncultured Corynebacterium sp. TaxID=159447 RepID=UPI0025941162|nr:response regulator transcription factor [uncultured Corynebacterium sp.]
MSTKAIIVDDHDMLLRGLCLILESVNGGAVEVVATTTDGSRALNLAQEHGADVVVTDAAMPGTDGVGVVKACSPFLPVLVLTTFDDAALVKELIGAGASGYILKDVSPEELTSAIVAVAEGGLILDPRIARHAFSSVPQEGELAVLTRAERGVAELVARGLNNREIAEALFLAEGTVKNHVSALLRKLQARDRTVLALHLSKVLDL